MKKIARNIVVAVALLALTITGIWAAFSGAAATFGGRVTFNSITSSFDFVGTVSQKGAGFEAVELQRYEYWSELYADTTDPGLVDWNLEDIAFTTAKNQIVYSFEFRNGLEEGTLNISIDVPVVAAPLSIEGGLVGSTGDTASIAVDAWARFEYTLTFTVAHNAIVDENIEFGVTVTEA